LIGGNWKVARIPLHFRDTLPASLFGPLPALNIALEVLNAIARPGSYFALFGHIARANRLDEGIRAHCEFSVRLSLF
jgi:hypothetical protein